MAGFNLKFVTVHNYAGEDDDIVLVVGPAQDPELGEQVDGNKMSFQNKVYESVNLTGLYV